MNGAISTINVVEWYAFNLQQIVAFPNTPEGKKAAEDLLVKMAGEVDGRFGCEGVTDPHPFTQEERAKIIADSEFDNEDNWIIFMKESRV